MPDLNYGVNLDLPPSTCETNQFHQRLGRVGRTQPGTFIILAPSSRFSAYGETLRDYYDNSVNRPGSPLPLRIPGPGPPGH